MTTLVQSFLDGFSSFLQVTSPTIKAWMRLNFGKISSMTSELAALERLKNQLSCDHSSAFIFDWIFFILAGKKVKRTTIKALIGPIFGQIRPWTLGLAALEHLQKFP